MATNCQLCGDRPAIASEGYILCADCGEDLDSTHGTATAYGDWRIDWAPAPIPTQAFDYAFWHKDFAGEGDNRCGHAESVIDAMTQINDLEDEAFECGCTAAVPGECMALTCEKRDDANARYAAYRAEADRFAVAVPA